MSTYHEFKCDWCLRRVKVTYNGEHYLPPQGWVQLYDPTTALTLDLHTCEKCFKDPRTKKAKK